MSFPDIQIRTLDWMEYISTCSSLPHLRLLQWLPTVYRIKSQSHSMVYKTLLNLVALSHSHFHHTSAQMSQFSPSLTTLTKIAYFPLSLLCSEPIILFFLSLSLILKMSHYLKVHSYCLIPLLLHYLLQGAEIVFFFVASLCLE